MLGQPLAIGTGFLLFGLAFILLAWSLLRIVPRVRPALREMTPQSFVKVKSHQDAILVVQAGGRVSFLNEIAREWFDLSEGEYPGIERMSRRVRPGEVFFEICAAEGQARFSINGSLVDATSYNIPGANPSILVTIRAAGGAMSPSEGDTFSSATLQTIAEFGREVASNLNLEATLETTLTHIEQLVPVDFIEVKVRNAAGGVFTPYSLVGPAGSTRTLQPSSDSQFGEYETFLIKEKRELFLPDTRVPALARFDPKAGRLAPMGSYIGLPLISAGDMVGLLEVGVIPVNGFAEDDLRLLRMVSAQAAIAIRNALTYEDQQRWTSQLLGLTNLSQTVGTLRDIKELFPGLVAGIASLFDVNILGFLLYDEQRRTLDAQDPFEGLSSQFVGIYRITVPANSSAEKRIFSQELVTSLDASQDPVWAELGLQDLSQAASMRDTTLSPLVSAGRFLGFLQLSNHKHGNIALAPDELRLLNLVTSQAAAIIDNALLVQQARQRNQRAESLRRIANLVSSNASLDEILHYSVNESARLLQADFASLFLLDEEEGTLRAHLPSIYGVEANENDEIARLDIRPALFHLTVAGSQRPFLSGNLSSDRRVLPMYRAFIRRLKVESSINVPLVAHGQGIGEMMFSACAPDLFNNYDLQVASTIASQLAVAIENARHGGSSGAEISHPQTDQTTSIIRVARELNTTTDLREQLRILYDEVLKISGADCGSAFLFEEHLASTAERQVSMFFGHAMTGGMTKRATRAIESHAPLLWTDFNQELPHDGVKATLLMPVFYQENTFGLIELHSANPACFTDDIQSAVRAVAVQAALAVGNTVRYREQQHRVETMRRRVEALNQLFETSRSLRAESELENALQAIARGIQRATPFQIVLISLLEPQTGLLRRVVGAGISPETFATLQAHQQPWASVAQLLKPQFEIGDLFFIPNDQMPLVPSEVQMITVTSSTSEAPNSWNPDDMLVIPIYDRNDSPLGLISVDAPRDGQRPDRITLELLEGLALQAALTIAGGQRLSALHGDMDLLNMEVDRQKSLVGFSQRSLPMLLHKDLEQTISISDLNQRGMHIRAGLQLTEAISRQVDASSALLTLGQQILASFDMTVALVAKETPEGPRIIHMLGSLPRGANPDAMFGQRNPLRTCLQGGETIISANVDEDETWHDTPFLTAIKARSFIAIPVVINNHPIAAVLAVDPEAMPTLSSDDRQVYFQISRQVSIILQNISLLSETRQRLEEVNLLLDFSRRLSGLNPTEILQTLLESALRVVNAAHAGFVLLWDAREEALLPQAASSYADNENILSIPYRMGEGLPGRVFEERQPRRVDEINFAADYNLPAEQLLKYRKATGGRLPVSSILIPIQTSQRNLGIVVLDNFNAVAAFRADDEAILLSLTQQVALSLENVRLVQATQERAGQLQALNAVASTISSSLKREELIASLLDRLKAVIAYDTAILWLRQENRMIVAEASGFADDEDRKGISVDVDDSVLLKEMTRSGQAISVGDVRSDQRFPTLVEATHLSWLGVPLIAKGEVIGVIAVEKQEANFYSREQVQLAATFASQAAVALENANLFEESLRRAAELDERSQRLALLNQFSFDLSASLNTDQVLHLTANQLMRALSAERAMLILLDRNGKNSLLSVLPDETDQPAIYRTLPGSPMLEHLRQSQTVYTAEDITTQADLASLTEFMPQARALLALPISTSRNIYAILVQSALPRRFSSTEIELTRTLGNQAGIALENADLYQSTLATAERLGILNQVSAEINAKLDPEQIYVSIQEAIRKLMPVDAFIVAILDENQGDIDAAYVMDMGQRISGVRLSLGQGLSGSVIATGQPLMTMDAAEADLRGGVTIGEKGTPHSIIAVPMLSGSKVIGVLSAQSYQFNAYADADLQILGTLANQASVAILNGRLFSETQQLAATLEQRVVDRTAELAHEQRNTETLLRILTEVSASLDLDRALGRTLALLNDALGAEQGTIMLLHPEDNMLHYRAGYGYATGEDEQASLVQNSNFKLKVGEGLAGWVVKHRQPVLVEDLYSDPRWVVSQNSSQQHRSAIVSPLMAGEDVIGSIMVFHRKVGFFSADALEMVKAIGAQVAIAISNAQLYQLIRDQAERLGTMLRNQQMEASRQTAILEAVADGVLVTDPANIVSFVNNSVESILGLTLEQIEGQPVENFSGLFGKSSQTWIETVRSWSGDASSERAGETFAEQINLENGRVVLVHLAPVIWQKEFLGTVSIFRDITHEVEVDRLKSEFVATVSHELRTPMTSIRGYVDVLLMGAAGAVSENQRHFLDIVKSNTERLNILVNDLLDISRIEAGRVTLSYQSVDLCEAAENVVADMTRRSQEENKPMTVTLDAEPKLPRVLGDAERVQQIINNLVDNAYNYTPENGHITIRMRRENDSVRVDVQDSGIGVAPENQERVFDRFFRGEDPLVLATPGTGLGLPIVKQLVEMHRGKIWMTSAGIPGQGSTFSFTLPVEKSE